MVDPHDHGRLKYGPSAVLRSSIVCDWSGVGAELRHHGAGELPPFDLIQTELGIATRCEPRAVVSRRGDGVSQSIGVRPGTIWTCPEGVREEDIRLVGWHECLHVYLPASRFAGLSEVRGGASVTGGQVRYVSGLEDALIRQIAWTLLEELKAPSAAGRIVAESLALSLTARLVQVCAPPAAARQAAYGPRGGLDDARLARVLDYVNAHLEQDIGVDDLAGAACISPFHFSRMFHARMGMPPSRYLSSRRLERAKSLLAREGTTISDVALACCFSSQANFTRAFRRATGVTPGAFRKTASMRSDWENS